MEAFNCPVCSEFLVDAMVIECGHIVCADCLWMFYEKDIEQCPICREKMVVKQFKKVFQITNMVEYAVKMLPENEQQEYEALVERKKSGCASLQNRLKSPKIFQPIVTNLEQEEQLDSQSSAESSAAFVSISPVYDWNNSSDSSYNGVHSPQYMNLVMNMSPSFWR
jgi:hypothetical protein